MTKRPTFFSDAEYEVIRRKARNFYSYICDVSAPFGGVFLFFKALYSKVTGKIRNEVYDEAAR
ncbi:hypothetical protein JT739_11625 [Tepidanaerobacter sp. GT38]|uniref:hypothetical protein n=1 Tax=Tepidanaerobacter sp. GT38 TaxID=2722793 RepID=UPI001F16E471|nr:hypothetical protein [Tepidanaerobacter sp. GT38]MCG1013240.1 hypothetical protein [Tepidanaerobacter sp. GT38]